MTSFKLQSKRNGCEPVGQGKLAKRARLQNMAVPKVRSSCMSISLVNATRRFFLLLLSLIGFFVEIPNCILSNVLI
jgi:hypothetical protein